MYNWDVGIKQNEFQLLCQAGVTLSLSLSLSLSLFSLSQKAKLHHNAVLFFSSLSL